MNTAQYINQDIYAKLYESPGANMRAATTICMLYIPCRGCPVKVQLEL